MIYLLVILSFALAAPLTFLARHYAIKKQLVDIPDERRNHRQATPRGGGIGFVISFSTLLIVVTLMDLIVMNISLVMLASIILITAMGYMDDHRNISSISRLASQVIAAVGVMLFLPLPESFHVIANFYVTGWALQAGVFISIIWLINVYNFMDGIDGITSIEVISVCLLMYLLLFWQNDLNNQALLLLLLPAAVTGFLLFNWPPASIFMGDVGSCFLGLVMGIMSLLLWSIGDANMWAWVILQGVFVIDSVVTLLRRAARGVKVFDAHSQHAFQHAFRRFNSAHKILMASFIIKLLWLAPWAYAVVNLYVSPLIGLVLAYIPLVVITFYFKAGSENQNTTTH